MKRQRGGKEAAERTVTTVIMKKKAKGRVEKAKEAAAEKVVEERKEAAAEVAVEVEWGGLWSGVDEEMPWATSWIPFWEMEATGDAYDALYGDVLWDFDIWDLKAIGNIAPTP